MEFNVAIVILLLGTFGALGYALYLGKKEFDKYEAMREQPEEYDFKDMQIILDDGTLYQSYEKILLTHYSERVYQVYTLKDEEKVFVTRFHLGENMMLMVRNSEL